MSHVEPLAIDINQSLREEPMRMQGGMKAVLWCCFLLGLVTLVLGLCFGDLQHVWAAFYTNALYWTGLSVGCAITAVIFQIVRAVWASPIRRLGEANVAFLPWAWLALMFSYFGGEYLFPWFKTPMPGREWWMNPEFVYTRFAVLFGILFILLWRFVRLSVRGDVGLIREKNPSTTFYKGWLYQGLTRNWKGSVNEVPVIQNKMSFSGPIIIVVYVVTYTLFCTEMLGGIDVVWYANMFGGFNFVGNIFMGWCMLVLLTTYIRSFTPGFKRTVTNQQYWDLGKLMFGFTMFWGYLFFSHFLPQWYGNLPEETQWLILRTREFPWKGWSYVTFTMCFILPFILLLSRDLKRTPAAISTVAVIVLLGIWSEKYVVIMPNFSPNVIPFSGLELGFFFGFLGVYGLSVLGFLSKFPYTPVASPMAKGETSW